MLVQRVDVGPASEFVNVRASMDYYRERLQKQPEVVRNYVELAQLHLQQARVTGLEEEHIPAARRLLRDALSRDPDNFHALALKGSLMNTLHRFEEARVLALKLIARNEKSTFSYGILTDALVELGRYDEAVEACDRMLAIRPELPAYARASYLRQLHGDTDGAIEAMRLAAEAGVSGTESRAWALYNLGRLYLETGRIDTARFIFDGILEERPNYAFAIAGLAAVKAETGDYDGAAALYRQAYREEPRQEFLEGMLEVYTSSGKTSEAKATLEKIRRAYEDADRMGENVDMEYADFLAEHELDIDKAVRLARREYERRPDHLHALETYAWALHRAGRSAEAAPLIRKAMRFGTHDATMRGRADAIFRASAR